MPAKNWSLEGHIKFNHEVLNVYPNDDGGKSWKIQIRKNETGREFEEFADVIMVCSSLLSIPKEIDVKGQENFQGQTLHSISYKESLPFANKKVLVIGAGNSGADIAVDLSNVAEKVFI